MDINCVLNCIHQKNGKCALVVVPTFIARQKPDLPDNLDCAYYEVLL